MKETDFHEILMQKVQLYDASGGSSDDFIEGVEFAYDYINEYYMGYMDRLSAMEHAYTTAMTTLIDILKTTKDCNVSDKATIAILDMVATVEGPFQYEVLDELSKTHSVNLSKKISKG